MGRHHKKKPSKKIIPPQHMMCEEIPRHRVLKIAENIEEPSEPKLDRPQVSRGGTLRFYEYTVFPRMGVRV